VLSLAQGRDGRRQVMQDHSVRSARLVCNAAVIRMYDIYYLAMYYMMLGITSSSFMNLQPKLMNKNAS